MEENDLRGDALFWRTCCERGIAACQIPRPMRESETVWMVTKSPTFVDRRSWAVAHTFASTGEMVTAIRLYFASGSEPKVT